MNTFIPEDDSIRSGYSWSGHDSHVSENRENRAAEFDRWLKAHDAKLIQKTKRTVLIERAVKAILPNVTNETAAWNTWNNLASDPDFVAAILEMHRDD